MSYAVEITDAVLDAIEDQARYIAIDHASPLNSERWIERVFDAVDGLSAMPQRHALAIEDEYLPYEVRRVLIGNHHLLFTVDERAKTVWVIGLRHGSRLPRPRDLPPEMPT